ncbi:MAG: site-2 protease family protein, partial [Burkholderiaceae bacterium]|nr:site-2 protease family protein [Burkholderiaceae bacterium]
MSTLQTLVAFLAALTLLIFVHELGHYLVARWCDVKVLRFS